MNRKPRSFWLTPTGWAALGLIGAVSYFLLVEHKHHFFGYLPFLILLLCPLMHVFMHGSHGKHIDTSHEEDLPQKNNNLTDKSDAYRKGYLEGLKTARKENESKEGKHER